MLSITMWAATFVALYKHGMIELQEEKCFPWMDFYHKLCLITSACEWWAPPKACLMPQLIKFFSQTLMKHYKTIQGRRMMTESTPGVLNFVYNNQTVYPNDTKKTPKCKQQVNASLWQFTRKYTHTKTNIQQTYIHKLKGAMAAFTHPGHDCIKTHDCFSKTFQPDS